MFVVFFYTQIKPFFSIAIPTYGYNGRGAEFLEHSLEIILNQTYKDYEIILSDHSTDDTIKNVFNRWKSELNIKYYSNDVGRGIISPNINNAMKYCNGEWIKVLFQDDFLFLSKDSPDQSFYFYPSMPFPSILQ